MITPGSCGTLSPGWTDIVTIDADQPADYVTAQILEALSRLDRRPVA
jgi:hypothetical protein